MPGAFTAVLVAGAFTAVLVAGARGAVLVAGDLVVAEGLVPVVVDVVADVADVAVVPESGSASPPQAETSTTAQSANPTPTARNRLSIATTVFSPS